MMRSALPDNASRPEPTEQSPQRGRARRSLRKETAILHETVERHFAPGRMTRDAYIQYLMMNGPFASIEPALEAASVHRVLPDWDMRQRRFDLESDMDAMGIPTSETRAIPISDDIGTLLGWSYVLEGSRLGARFILKGIESTRDRELIAATRFLRHGTGIDLWTTFTAALSRIDNDPPAIECACEAARAAFSQFMAVTDILRPSVLTA
jgi:heme oxygenase